MVDPQLVAEGEIEAGVESLTEQVGGESDVPRQSHSGQTELALLVVPVGVVEGRLADEELRHVVEPELVEVVTADHDEQVRVRAREGRAEGLDLRDPLVREGRPGITRGGAGPR